MEKRGVNPYFTFRFKTYSNYDSTFLRVELNRSVECCQFGVFVWFVSPLKIIRITESVFTESISRLLILYQFGSDWYAEYKYAWAYSIAFGGASVPHIKITFHSHIKGFEKKYLHCVFCINNKTHWKLFTRYELFTTISETFLAKPHPSNKKDTFYFFNYISWVQYAFSTPINWCLYFPIEGLEYSAGY